MKNSVLFFLRHILWFLNIPIILMIAVAIIFPLAGLPGNRLFSLLCHHLPSRSPHLLGESIWLCYRCLALYLSFLLGALAWRILGLTCNVSRRELVIALALSLPLLIDGVTQYLGFRTSQNWLRVLTGSMMGFVWGWLINQGIGWEKSHILERRIER